MKKKKGQALVEFVIILPIFIFLLFAIIDIGKMITMKSRLESEMDFVVEEYHNQKTFDEISEILKENNKNVKLEVENENNQYVTFILKEDMDIITPGLNLIFKNPFVIVKRSILYES